MAYNSDGYIMIDFTEVDFRRTNQTIEGLYKRCVDVIGTNKFILVINANRKTPLPSVCSFINNQYVIESCIYTFAVSANDNLFIKRNEPDPASLIDDNVIMTTKTWSSDKINTELGGKADTSALANYQPLLTAGDLINISDNVISVDAIKKVEYTGVGGHTRTITFPTKPKYILSIERNHTTETSNDPEYKLIGGAWNYTFFGVVAYKYANQNNIVMGFCKLTYNDSDNILTLTSSDGTAGLAMNSTGLEYTVYYI